MRRDLIGETLLNQFRVESYVASGGMATIYRVWDLHRSVPLAMKVLQPELAQDPAFMARFQREASSLQMLVHPHIVPFYGLYHASDLTFLLERYVDGPSLDELLRQRAGKPLPLRDVLVYFKALYTSLGYAHNQGIIHCDVKPGNVLIDQGGHIYLTDFGIARYKDSSATTSSALGTPLYMAPEQVRGDRVTPHSDIYSLGVVLFELLTGQRPFRGEGDIPDGIGTNISDRVRYQQLYTSPPDPRSVNPDIPEAMAGVVQRAMSKAPTDRYPSVQAMADDISRAVAARFDTLPDRVNLAEEWNVQPPDGAAPAWLPADSSPKGPDEGAPPADWVYQRDADSTLPGFPTDDPPAGLPAGAAGFPASGAGDGIPWEPQTGWPPSDHPPARTRPALWWFPWLMGLALLFLCGLGTYSVLRWGAQAAQGRPGVVVPPDPTQTPGGPTATNPLPTETSPAPTATQPGDPTITPTFPPVPTPTATNTLVPRPELSDFAIPGQIAVPIRSEGIDRLFLLDSSGSQSPLPGVPNVEMGSSSAPAWSPDGRRLVWVSQYNSRPHVVAMSLDNPVPYQLPAGEAYARLSTPGWLPDGQRLSFWASGGGGSFLVIADGASGEELNRVALPSYRNLFAWNWQNSLVAFIRQVNNQYEVVVSSSAETTDRPIPAGAEAYAPAWSTDGQWLAYQSSAGRNPGDDEIWIARADGSEMRKVTNKPVGTWSRAPTWSPDGRYIAYVSNFSGSLRADYGELFVVDITTGEVRQMTSTGGQVYDWRPAWQP